MRVPGMMQLGWRRGLVAVVATVVVAATGCGPRRDEAPAARVDIERPRSATGSSCEELGNAERDVTEASLTAGRADDAAIARARGRLDDLAAAVPPTLSDEVVVLRRTFEAVWADRAGREDPFDADDYVDADQALRRYVVSGCVEPPA